jgi:hypothetical protein
MRTAIHLNDALWEDLQRRLGTTDLLSWIEQEVERLAALGRTHLGRIEFGRDLLRACGIVRFAAKPNLGALASINPSEHGYELFYRPFQRVTDQRFWIAHEIAHTFWFDPKRRGRPLSPLQSVLGPDPTIEWLCNRTAAALLIPARELSPFKDRFEEALALIPELARRYVVPERLLARRIFHDWGKLAWNVLAVQIMDRGGDGRVLWMAASPTQPLTGREPLRRIVPAEILPTRYADASLRIELDSRWWSLARGGTRYSPAKRLANLPSSKYASAYASRTGTVWYVALPPTDIDGD